MKTGNEKGKNMTAARYSGEESYCRYEGEHSQRQRHLYSGYDQTELCQ